MEAHFLVRRKEEEGREEAKSVLMPRQEKRPLFSPSHPPPPLSGHFNPATATEEWKNGPLQPFSLEGCPPLPPSLSRLRVGDEGDQKPVVLAQGVKVKDNEGEEEKEEEEED